MTLRFSVETISNRNAGSWILGGIGAAFVCYFFYRLLSKDRTEEIEQFEMDLDDVIFQLERLKELRMEPGLSDTDRIRVRSFLLTLLLRQTKEDSVHIVDKSLVLLKQRRMDKREKEILFHIQEIEEPKIPKPRPNSLPKFGKLRMAPSTESIDVTSFSAAFEDDATHSWWHKISYICILRMKRSGALFMAPVPDRGPEAFTLVGFEDPEEALHAGKMPIHQQRWGVISKMMKNGTKPSRPLMDEKHFDLTWLHPKEFNTLLQRAGCLGVVIPAGTLRSSQTGRPIPTQMISDAIAEICSDSNIGAMDAQEDLTIEASLSNSESETSQMTSSMNVDQEFFEPKNYDSIVDHDKKEESPSTVSEPEIRPKQTSPSTKIDSRLNGASIDGLNKKANPRSTIESISDFNVPVNGHRLKNETYSSETSNRLWWTKLESIVVPKIKPEGKDGGNVEVDISIDSDAQDFRPILFEEEHDAKAFLGVLGRLHGPGCLVAVQRQSPSEFLSASPKIDKLSIIVLCKGALVLDRFADHVRLRTAVRLAHVATEIKMGINKSKRASENSFDEKALKLAQDMVSKFEDRFGDNGNSKNGKNPDYEDPIEGLLHDFKTLGIDDLLHSAMEDGISSEIDHSEDEEHFRGSHQNGNTKSEDYLKFVSQMNHEMDQKQSYIHNSFKTKQPLDEDDLDTSLDDLIRKEMDEASKSKKSDDGFEVIYPETTENGGKKNARGPAWFCKLEVVYMPQLLTSEGSPSYLAIYDPELECRLLVGFQSAREAAICKEIMSNWSDKENVASAIVPQSPETVLHFCEENHVIPVVLRRNSFPLQLSMSQQEFFANISIMAQAQSIEFTSFNK